MGRTKTVRQRQAETRYKKHRRANLFAEPGVHDVVRALERSSGEALVLDPDGQLLQDGRGHFAGQPRHLLFGKEIGVALDYCGLGQPRSIY